MKQVQSDHLFSIPRDTYVHGVFFNEDFQTALHKHLNFVSRTLIEREEDEDHIRLKIDFVSGEKLPRVARKLWGKNVGWLEDLTYFKKEFRTESVMTPQMLKNKLTIRATIRFEEPSAGSTRHVATSEVDVRIPMVGGAIAKKMVADTASNFLVSFAYTDTYIRDHAIGKQAGPARAGASKDLNKTR